jgi:hypothetical protein
MPGDEIAAPKPNKEQNDTSGKNHWYDPYFWLLLITAIATSAAAYFTCNQWLTAVDSEKRQLRAYVGIEYIKIECPSCNSEKYTPILPVPGTIANDVFRVSIRNSGGTPARKLMFFISWVATPWPQGLANDFNFPDGARITVPGAAKETSVVVVHPNTSYESNAAIADANQFIAARNKTALLWVFGHIDYVDIFDAPQTTTFCYLYEPWQNQEKLSVACGRHNDAT